MLMGYIVSRDCSISVTVSRENTKNVTVKREEKKYCLSFQNTFQQIPRFTVKVIPQFCIAHFYCAHLITYDFIHYTYRLKKKSFYDNFMLLQNIFGYIRAKINALKSMFSKKAYKSVACVCSIFIYLYFTF